MSDHPSSSGYFLESDCALSTFKEICARQLETSEVPLAREISKNIPIYDASALNLEDLTSRQQIMSEWAHNFRFGSGVIVVKNAQTDHEAIDAASGIFDMILKEESEGSGGAGDHFAKAGANGRIWNALQKLCEKSPDVFIRYHGSAAIDAVAESWLGPAYQMTTQVNLVRPGGAAQEAHRDYHLGFMSAAQAGAFPTHVHELSPLMTLQGALAHLDIEIEAGPTKLLPFSQLYKEGYMAWRRDDFRQYFEENYIQLPLSKGDALFFNPAVFHAGGENRTSNTQRLVNLLQISSPMGRAMETVNRARMCDLAYPALLASDLGDMRKNAAIASMAEGYAFPTNLDLDPPLGGLSPKTQADLIREAVLERKSETEWFEIHKAYQDRKLA